MKKTSLLILVPLLIIVIGSFTFFSAHVVHAQATAATTNSTSATFVPLTNIPGLFGSNGITNAQGLTAFFNDLYKICIGVAASLAVLQLVRAGVMYMGGDSVTETKEARALIVTAISGLLLVLSPVIVFSIINPKILDLQIGLSNLTPSATTNTAVATTPTTPATGSPCTPGGTGAVTNSGIYLGGAKGCVATTNGVNTGTVGFPCGKSGCGPYESECTNQGGTPGQVTGSGANQTFTCNYPSGSRSGENVTTAATTYTCTGKSGCGPYISECINNGGTAGTPTGTGANQSFICSPPAAKTGT